MMMYGVYDGLRYTEYSKYLWAEYHQIDNNKLDNEQEAFGIKFQISSKLLIWFSHDTNHHIPVAMAAFHSMNNFICFVHYMFDIFDTISMLLLLLLISIDSMMMEKGIHLKIIVIILSNLDFNTQFKFTIPLTVSSLCIHSFPFVFFSYFISNEWTNRLETDQINAELFIWKDK